MLSRRGFLGGMAGILAGCTAPAFIRDAMPIRRLDGLTEFIEPVDVSMSWREYVNFKGIAGTIHIYSGAIPADASAPVDPSRLIMVVPPQPFRFSRKMNG